MSILEIGDIENIEYQSLLFDFYGSLLSSNQNEVMALYHEDNLSLSEIAAELGTTRQAVHYTLKKAEKTLQGYEEKLGLVAGYHRNQELADRARAIIEELSRELTGVATDNSMDDATGVTIGDSTDSSRDIIKELQELLSIICKITE